MWTRTMRPCLDRISVTKEDDVVQSQVGQSQAASQSTRKGMDPANCTGKD